MQTSLRVFEESINLPQVNVAKEITVAEITVQILSKEWPLSLKSLQWKVNKEHGKAATFQATHKALNKLVMQGILEKKNRQYQLSQKWLNQVIEFGTHTRQAYAQKIEEKTSKGLQPFF